MKTFCLVSLLFLATLGAFAQNNVDETQGLKPYDSWHGGDLDSVSLTNGALALHIPLVCFPQRGSLELCYSITYSGKQWTVLSQCQPTTQGQNCTYQWEPLPRGGKLPYKTSIGINYPVSGAFIAASTDWWFQRAANISLPQYSADIMSPDGNIHSFGTSDSSLVYPLHSIDATGLLQLNANTLILPNGTRLDYPNSSENSSGVEPTAVIDANGNQITLTSSGWTDSLQRTIPGSTGSSGLMEPGIASTDLSRCPAGAATARVWDVPAYGPAGTTRRFTFCYSNVSISTNFPNPGGFTVTQYSPTNTLLLTAVVLPDGTMWTLAYDNYGSITRLGFPTGGSLSYGYGFGPGCCSSSQNPTGSRWVTSRSVDANDGSGGHTWQYNYTGQVLNGANGESYSGATTVTSPDSNDTVHTITSPVALATNSLYDTQVQYYEGPASGGTLLKTAATQYSGIPDNSDGGTAANVVPVQTSVTLPGNKTSRIVNTYDSGTLNGNFPVVLGSVLQRDEYDFSNTLVRSTVNHYLWQDNATYKADNFLGLITSTTVKDGTGQQVAQTTSAYDQYGSTGKPAPSGIVSPSLVAPPAGEPYRGNLTTVNHWLNTNNSFIPSTATYYDTGMRATSTDPRNNTTTYTYSSGFLGAYLTQTHMPDTQMPDSGAPIVHHIINGNYDYNTGLLTSFTDENGQAFSYTYDNMLRLATASHPDGGQTRFTYPDPLTVDRQRLIDTTRYDHYQVGFDGLGRPIQTRQFTPDCASSIKVDTTYDLAGRAKTVSNPYCVTIETTYGITQTDYDGLSRAIKTTRQDQSFSTIKYDDTPADPLGSPVSCTTATDESGRQRQACSDSQGRLVKVIEQNPDAPATNATGSVVVSGSEQSTGGAATPGTGTVTIGGFEQSACDFDACPPSGLTYDSGSVSITVNGIQKTVAYGRNSTASSIASAFVSQFSCAGGSQVGASASANVVTLTACVGGSTTNYSFSASVTSSNPADFTPPSFSATPSGATLAGGHDAGISDSGTITVNVNGTGYATSFGASDTASTIASRLAGIINSGSFSYATASGTTINLTSKTAGGNTDYSLSTSYTWNSGTFAQPSFTTSASGASLSGGYDASALPNNPFITHYQYDTLSNLLCVHQKGADTTADKPCNDTTVPAAWRPRVFTYDSLSRLLTAYNPESGTTFYGYDADGNMSSKTAPAPNQLWGSSPLQQVTITYAYDPLNRLLSKTYPAGDPTPSANYRYDYSSFMGQTFSNPVGRLVATLSANGANEFTSYEQMGRVAATTECIPGVSGCKSFTAAYDKLGDLTSLGYPANSFSVTYSYDSAARLYDATDSANVNYAHLDPTNSASFWASGAMKEFTATNFSGFKYHVDYNNRLQPVEIWTGASAASNLFDKRYSYDSPGATHQNNGNIYTITNVKDSTRTQTFTYDVLNRLISAGDQTHWANQYQYDAWGNMQKIKLANVMGENLQIAGDSWNHMTGYSYDAAGNMLQDGVNQWTYIYDSENRVTSAGSTSYTYDADGRRVKKSSGTNYWYGPTGAVLAETDSAGNWTNYIFFGGQRLARNVSGDIKYYVTDHLHSTGIFADKSGTVLDDNDFYPWGGAVPGVRVSSSNNHYKFTGKERDGESQLDYFGARYYSNGLGRFMSADWGAKPVTVPFAKFGDPQSLNLYAYVENGPINHIDTDGHSYALLDTRNSSGGETPSFDAEIYFFGHGFDPGASGHRQESPSTPSTNQPQQPTLNVATDPHTKNQSGLTFPSGGDDIGPVTIDGRGWFWNVLLTGTLPVGADPSQYGIKQSYKDSTKVITQDGKKHNYPSKRTEVLTSNGQWSITKGNTIFAADSPGPHNTANGDLVDSVTTEIHFKSWLVRGDKRVSDQINWFVKIVVTRGTLDTNASKAGLE